MENLLNNLKICTCDRCLQSLVFVNEPHSAKTSERFKSKWSIGTRKGLHHIWMHFDYYWVNFFLTSDEHCCLLSICMSLVFSAIKSQSVIDIRQQNKFKFKSYHSGKNRSTSKLIFFCRTLHLSYRYGSWASHLRCKVNIDERQGHFQHNRAFVGSPQIIAFQKSIKHFFQVSANKIEIYRAEMWRLPLKIPIVFLLLTRPSPQPTTIFKKNVYTGLQIFIRAVSV